MKNSSNKIISFIVIAQFFCTSLWFASNSVMSELSTVFHLDTAALGNLTSAVQFGFIAGTLLFAFLAVADRFSPSKVFFVSAVFGSLFNLAILIEYNTYASLLSLRFLTGFTLAGIYPVGMKIASDYFDKGLGKTLGYLVGALVLGTAFPHLLKSLNQTLPWESVIIITSILAFFGGLLILFFVPDGPFRKPNLKPKISEITSLFKPEKFRKAAFGYFGHMWELYAFWTFVPLLFTFYAKTQAYWNANISLISFFTIAIGSLACVLAGHLSEKFDTKKLARLFLVLSGICCLLSPFFFYLSPTIFITFAFFWGATVIADSPLFSTLIAQNCNGESKGSALTLVNCIGFSITIISIQTMNYLAEITKPEYLFLILRIGPLLGSIGLFSKKISK